MGSGSVLGSPKECSSLCATPDGSGLEDDMRLSKHHDLSAFASKDETRYNLTGVCVDPVNSNVAATNGHFLAVVSVVKDVGDESPQNIAGETIIEAKALSAALKALPKKGTVATTTVGVLKEGDDRVRLQNCTATHVGSILAGPFPKVDQVIPPQSEHKVGLSAVYLRTIADYVVKHATQEGKGITVYLPTDPLSPVRFEATVGDTADTAVFVLMPMRL